MKKDHPLLRTLRTYLDPVFYYILRPIRVALFYFAFLYAAKESTARLPFGDPEYWDYDPFKYHLCCTFSNAIVFLFIIGIFVLYDSTARRRFCRKPTAERHRFSEHFGILRSWEFISNAAGLVLFPLFWGLEAFSHPLYLLFPLENMGQTGIYLLYLLCVLPWMLLMDFAFRMRTRTFWRKLTEEEAAGVCFDFLKLFVLWAMVAFGYTFLAPLYLPVIPFLGKIFWALLRSPLFWFIALALMLAVLLGKRIRAVHRQKRFLQKLQKLCAQESIPISPILHPHRSIFRYDSKPDFILTLGGRTYAVKLFPALSKSAEMTFVDETMGYFRHSIRIRRNELFSSRRRFRYAFENEGADQKILLILPAPNVLQLAETKEAFTDNNTTYVKESGRFHKLYDASALFDMTVYSGQAFLHALERDCLHLSEEIQ